MVLHQNDGAYVYNPVVLNPPCNFELYLLSHRCVSTLYRGYFRLFASTVVIAANIFQLGIKPCPFFWMFFAPAIIEHRFRLLQYTIVTHSTVFFCWPSTNRFDTEKKIDSTCRIIFCNSALSGLLFLV